MAPPTRDPTLSSFPYNQIYDMFRVLQQMVALSSFRPQLQLQVLIHLLLAYWPLGPLWVLLHGTVPYTEAILCTVLGRRSRSFMDCPPLHTGSHSRHQDWMNCPERMMKSTGKFLPPSTCCSGRPWALPVVFTQCLHPVEMVTHLYYTG